MSTLMILYLGAAVVLFIAIVLVFMGLMFRLYFTDDPDDEVMRVLMGMFLCLCIALCLLWPMVGVVFVVATGGGTT